MNIEKNSLLDIQSKIDLYKDRFKCLYNKKSRFFDRYIPIDTSICLDKSILDWRYLGGINSSISLLDSFWFRGF